METHFYTKESEFFNPLETIRNLRNKQKKTDYNFKMSDPLKSANYV